MTDTREEQHHLEVVEQELREEFPTAPAPAVHAVVRAETDRFRKARVRDFVPLFVKRRARQDLRQLG